MTFRQYFLKEIALNVLTPEEEQWARIYARMVYEAMMMKKEYEETKDESYLRMYENKNRKLMEFYQYVLSQGTDKKLFYNTYLKYYDKLKKQ